ncbi:hypothetical protein [Natronobiforma cellulositropha]|uniref:hypothetical protein n=1 Tax=Natronobiforma cellulositropha TaxID=1679076 RepID=UPI0021D5E0BB|nr:hypothetical protein [Natronobiforma cellulositropha]
MLSRENAVVVAAGLTTVVALAALVAVEATTGLLDEWFAVAAFVLVVLFGFVLPQVYLLRVDRTTSRTSRLGVVTLMLVLLAGAFSNAASGTAVVAIWLFAVATAAVIFLVEARAGYRETTGDTVA